MDTKKDIVNSFHSWLMQNFDGPDAEIYLYLVMDPNFSDHNIQDPITWSISFWTKVIDISIGSGFGYIVASNVEGKHNLNDHLDITTKQILSLYNNDIDVLKGLL